MTDALSSPTSAEILDALATLNQGAEEGPQANWCDVRNSYRVHVNYTGGVNIGGYGGSATIAINPSGTLRFVKVMANGKDVTDVIRGVGGDDVPLVNESDLCRRQNYHLGWELKGPAADAICKMVHEATHGVISPQRPQIWARYYSHNDTKYWFYFQSRGFWLNTELT